MKRSIRTHFLSICLLALLSMAASVPAIAQSGAVSVTVNMARILRISSPASTVVIGNPGVADVTIQDPQTLILTGRSFGDTNLIVLDLAGNPIVDTLVRVTRGDQGYITIYQGAARTSLACEPECQPIIMLGDDTGFTSTTIVSSDLVAQAAN